jgi:hypothetical protein
MHKKHKFINGQDVTAYIRKHGGEISSVPTWWELQNLHETAWAYELAYVLRITNFKLPKLNESHELS